MIASGAIPAAIVGSGRIARVHYRYLAGLNGVDVAAVCDLDAGARSQMSALTGAPAYASLDEMLRWASPAVVHVATPPATHAHLAESVLKAGAHVFLEKPMTLTLSEAELLLEQSRQSKRILTVDHNRWFDPVVLRARTLLEQGAIGDLVAVDVSQSVESETAETRLSWKTDLPGGPAYDVAPHPLYLARHFLGPVSSTQALRELDSSGGVSEARMLMRAERGFGSVTISSRSRPSTNRVRIFGSCGTMELNLNNMTLLLFADRKLNRIVEKVLPNLDLAWQLVCETVRNGVEFVLGRQSFYPGIGNHLRDFYGRLHEGREPSVTAELARDVVWLCHELLGTNPGGQS